MKKIEFKLEGLNCEACVKLSTNRFKKIPGVLDVNINLETGKTTVIGEEDVFLNNLEDSLVGTNYKIVK